LVVFVLVVLVFVADEVVDDGVELVVTLLEVEELVVVVTGLLEVLLDLLLDLLLLEVVDGFVADAGEVEEVVEDFVEDFECDVLVLVDVECEVE